MSHCPPDFISHESFALTCCLNAIMTVIGNRSSNGSCVKEFAVLAQTFAQKDAFLGYGPASGMQMGSLSTEHAQRWQEGMDEREETFSEMSQYRTSDEGPSDRKSVV